MTIVVKEAVSDLAGTLGDAFDGLMVGFDDPDARALLAVEDPAWSSTPGGILAFGECPQIAGHVGDATILAHVFVPDAAFCTFGECGAMKLTCTPSGSGWKFGATVFTPGGTASLLSEELPLSTSSGSYIAATYNAATGETKVFLAGIEQNDTTFGESRNRVSTLPIWRVGAGPGGWVTDFAVFDRILDPEEMPGFVSPATVTINQGSGQADPSTGSSIVFDVVFSEAVTGFATGDVTLSGTAGGTLVGTVADTGDHIHFTVTVTGMTSSGTVIADIGAAVCTAVSDGRPNAAATSTDNTVTYLGFPTPALWLEARLLAGKSDGDSVSSWTDMSGNGRHATTSASPGTANPIYKTNIVNGQPVIRFNGTSSGLDLPGSTRPGTAGEIFVVGKVDVHPPGAAAQAGHFVQMGGVSGAAKVAHYPYIDGLAYETWGTATRQDALAYPGGFSPSSFHCWAVRASGSINFERQINGYSIYSSASISVNWSQYGPYIGHANGSTDNRWLDGDIALILIFHSVLTTGQRTAVQDYITAEYGISF